MANGTKEKAVLFDIGRVLIDVDFEGAAKNVGEVTGRDWGGLWSWFESAPELVLLEKGEITPVEYYSICAKQLDLSLSYDQFSECWNNIFTVKWDVVEYFRSLHGRVTLGLLSNTNELHFQFIRERYPFLHSADYWFLSYRMGTMKPENRCYTLPIEYLGLMPENVFFTDDRPENVVAAKKAGMHAVPFENASKLQASCEAFLNS